MDALCVLGNGAKVNIEVQRSDNDNHLRRVRFNASSITVRRSTFIMNKNNKESLQGEAIVMLMMDLKRAEERADKEGWVDEDDLKKELGLYEKLSLKYKIV